MQEFPKLAEKITWFPGHMYRAHRLIKENISKIDIFIEVRDARVPFSSRNGDLDDVMQMYNKPKLIVFNKFDLCNQNVTNKAIQDYNKAKIFCLPLSAQLGTNISKITKFAKEVKPAKFQTIGMWLMIGGMPNVGKSTIINALRKESQNLPHKDVTKSAPLPCTTKSVTGFKISDDPLTYLVDTPGVMIPRIADDEIGLKLSLIGSIKDTIVGKEVLIDYLVWFLNKQKSQKYISYYELHRPATNGRELSQQVFEKYKHNNWSQTYDLILGHFRKGELGKFTLDQVNLSI